jgi:hypothetical protein
VNPAVLPGLKLHNLRVLGATNVQLAKMRASHSWRLTAPLRWLVARIGRIRSGNSA